MICVVVTGFLISVLLLIMCCGMLKRRRDVKAKKQPDFLASNFDDENVGVVSRLMIGRRGVGGGGNYLKTTTVDFRCV